jgi:hypothetical protein
VDVQNLEREGRTDPDARTEIDTAYMQAKVFTKGWHDNIVRWRKLYYFDHYSEPGEGGKRLFSDPTPTNTVDLAVGIFQSNEMTWTAEGWGPTAEGQTDTSDIEKYVKAVIDLNSDRNEYDIEYEVNLHFARDGGAVILSVWDTDIADEEMIGDVDYVTADGVEIMKTYKSCPIRTEVVEPLNIFLLPGGPNRWKAVIREEDMTVADVEARYGITPKEFKNLDYGQKLTQKVKFKDYWDSSRRKVTVPCPGCDECEGKDSCENDETITRNVVRNAVMVADEFLLGLRDMDGYDEIPYTVDFFNPTSRTDSKAWSNIVSPLESTVKWLEKAINRRQHQIDLFSSLPMIAKTVAGRQVSLDPGLANLVTLDAQEESVGFPEWPGNPPDIEEQIGFMRSRVQQSGFSDIMFGSGPNSVSGFALSQLGDQNRIRLEQPIAHLERLWTRVGRKYLSMTEEFAGESAIQIYGKLQGKRFRAVIKGRDLSGYQIWCEIKPDFPNERVRNHAMATQVKGILSDRTIMQEYLGQQQPDDERKQKIIEMAQSNPALLEYALISVLQEYAETEPAAAEALKALLAAKQTGQQPVEAGSKPEQPLGIQGANGQPSPQALGNPSPGQGVGDAINQIANSAPGMDGDVL